MQGPGWGLWKGSLEDNREGGCGPWNVSGLRMGKVRGAYYEVVFEYVALRTGGADTWDHGGGERPVLGKVDNYVGELEGKGEALEDCLDAKNIVDSGVKGRQVRRSAERVNGLDPGR